MSYATSFTQWDGTSLLVVYSPKASEFRFFYDFIDTERLDLLYYKKGNPEYIERTVLLKGNIAKVSNLA